MAVKRQLVSDLDGTSPANRVVFNVEGQWFQIDLSEREHEQMTEVLARYTQAGEAVNEETARLVLSKTGVIPLSRQAARVERDKIRVWAEQNGYQVNLYGKIPAEVGQAYDDAHNIAGRDWGID